MLDGSRPRRRSWWLRTLGSLRFLLIIPIFTAFQRRSDRSLRWRLVGSHLATVLLSLFGVALLLSLGVLLLNWWLNPFVAEPSLEAHEVAITLEDMDWPVGRGSSNVDTLLIAFADGAISFNAGGSDIDLTASAGRSFADIRSVSVVDPNGQVVSSSDPALVGGPVDVLGTSTRAITDRALRGG